MKKVLLILAITSVAVGAFAQGKVNIINSAGTVFRWGSAETLKPADQALAGTAIATSYTGLSYQLYGNPSATATADMLAALGNALTFPNGGLAAGRISGSSLSLSDGTGGTLAFPANTRATFQLKLWENSYGNYAAALAAGGYVGTSPVFTMVPGAATANSIVSSLSPAMSTWFNTPLNVGVIPEPATASLIGLGLASLLIFRRKK